MSYFFNPAHSTAPLPVARGRPEAVTLDFCGELVLNMWAGGRFPLVYHGSSRKAAAGSSASVSALENRRESSEAAMEGTPERPRFTSMDPVPDALCFIHYSGPSKEYPSFRNATAFFGV